MVFELSAVMTLSTMSFWLRPSSAGVHAIDIQPQRRIVHVLRNIDLAHAGQLADAAGQILRDVVSRSEIAPVDLNVDRRGHARVENGVHHRAALEERANIGEFGGQLVLARGPCRSGC